MADDRRAERTWRASLPKTPIGVDYRAVGAKSETGGAKPRRSGDTGTFDFLGINSITGTRWDPEGYDCHGYDVNWRDRTGAFLGGIVLA